MVTYETMILKFGKMGEKTGWTYIVIPPDVAERINPGIRTSYRVKGKLDSFEIKGVAILPMGEGSFIMALNADMRKKIGKKEGARLIVSLVLDKEGYQLNQDLLDCLSDDPEALSYFQSLPGGHQRYFSKWVESAKTDATRTKRITMAVVALGKKWGYPEMIRASKKESY